MKMRFILIAVLAFFIGGFMVGGLTVRAQDPQVHRPIEDTQTGMELMYELMKILMPNTAFESQPNATPNPAPTGTPTTATAIKNLRQLFEEIASKTGTSAKILEAVMIVESPGLYHSITDAQVQAYSQPGALVPGCTKNSCSAAGVMQFTTGVDNNGNPLCPNCCSGGVCSLPQKGGCPNAWASYRDSVNKFGGYAHQSNICNLRDNVYGAGAKIKADSGNKGGAWTQAQVTRAITAYYGACDNKHVYPRLGNRTYCDFVWWFYSSK